MRVAGFAVSLSSRSLRVFSFVFAEGLSGSLEYLLVSISATLIDPVFEAVGGLYRSFSCISIWSFTVFVGLSQNLYDPQRLC